MTITTLGGVCHFDAEHCASSLLTLILWDTSKPSHLHLLVRPPRGTLYRRSPTSPTRVGLTTASPPASFGSYAESQACNENGNEGKDRFQGGFWAEGSRESGLRCLFLRDHVHFGGHLGEQDDLEVAGVRV
jgi:hypothetical protein